MNSLGHSMRAWGRALDRLGRGLQGKNAHIERLDRHRAVAAFRGKEPAIGHACFVAPNANVIGDVQLGENSSVWYGAVVRGDVNGVSIGSNTNIQDRAIVHVSKFGANHPTKIGNFVTVGNGATVHGCTLEDESFVGMGASVMDGATVQKGAMVAAGAVVSGKKTVPSGELWAGSPAKKVRDLTKEEREYIRASAEEYRQLAYVHAEEAYKTGAQIEADKAELKERLEREELDDPNYIKPRAQVV